MRIRVCWYKNAGVAGYAEAFRPVQSDSQTSEWYSYFENDVLVFIDGWLGGNGGENEKCDFIQKSACILYFAVIIYKPNAWVYCICALKKLQILMNLRKEDFQWK